MGSDTVPVAIVCTSVLGALLFVLGIKTSLARQKAARGKLPLERVAAMSRAHGNTSEYAPFMAILFLLVNHLTRSQPGMFLNLVMVCGTVARVASAFGIANPLPGNVQNLPRYYGALGTYASGLMLSVAVLFLRDES